MAHREVEERSNALPISETFDVMLLCANIRTGRLLKVITSIIILLMYLVDKSLNASSRHTQDKRSNNLQNKGSLKTIVSPVFCSEKSQMRFLILSTLQGHELMEGMVLLLSSVC